MPSIRRCASTRRDSSSRITTCGSSEEERNREANCSLAETLFPSCPRTLNEPRGGVLPRCHDSESQRRLELCLARVSESTLLFRVDASVQSRRFCSESTLLFCLCGDEASQSARF